MTDMH